jgi:ribosomal subunit interface protein
MSTMHAPADVTIHGRHIEVSQKFREHVLHKIGRIEKFGIHVTRVDVEVTKEPNPRQHDHAFEVELTIAAKGPVIRAEASAADKFTAFDLAYGRLEERLRRAADRKHTKHGKHVKAAALLDAGVDAAPVLESVSADAEVLEFEDADVVYEDGPIVVRDKTHPHEPMTVADALHALELVGHDFFLFQDLETGQPTVVYKRRGYNYGLLRLEVQPAEQDVAS